MSALAESLSGIRAKMAAACGRAGRRHDSVNLIAVSKTFPVDAIREAMDAGLTVFGESKLQEAEPKIEMLPSSLHWHFIGRVQRNKVRKLLESFEAIHGVDSLRLAEHMNQVSSETGATRRIFLQVNIGEEDSKGGFAPGELGQAMEDLLKLNRLEILGLMAIPPADPNPEAARPWFARLRDLRDSLEKAHGVELPELSMGMSADYEIAIEEGATWVRVGSSLFGKRAYRVDGELG